MADKEKLKKIKKMIESSDEDKQDVSEIVISGMFSPIIEKLYDMNKGKMDALIKPHQETIESYRKKTQEEIKALNTLIEQHKELSISEKEELQDSLNQIEERFEEIDSTFEYLDTIYDEIKENIDFKGKESEKLFYRVIDEKIEGYSKSIIPFEKTEHAKKIISLDFGLEELKKIDHTPTFEGINKRFLDIDALIKKMGKGVYEYGSQLGVSINGKSVGQSVNNVDFKDGTNTTISYTQDNLGIHISVNSSGGSSANFIDNEIVSGSGTSWTLENTPILGCEHIFAEGGRLTPGVGNDYTISGKNITTANSYPAGSLLADYRK